MYDKKLGYDPIATTLWDPTDYLTSEEDIAARLSIALEHGDDLGMRLALRDIARAYSMGKVAKKAGVSRESLYRSLSAEGNPRFTTVMHVLDALGYTIEIKPKAQAADRCEGAQANDDDPAPSEAPKEPQRA